ncbi:MAG: hypothetical protein LQ348_000622 [Seirophora lacunosa]|nr:MAG: hypothetical protein LQ344_005002 [Seirophora lacunosa]KAI4207315.1 MAG: hypothetical protein LQ348_000622 [Seirophora lacunosa]
MHSALVRVQNVFGFFTTVAFCTAIAIALSGTVIPQVPSASLALRNVQVVKGRPHYHSPKKEEYAHIKFDLDADLTSLFNWNTKQLFVWVTAKYPSRVASEPPSQAVIWDAIISSESQKKPSTPFTLYSYLTTPTKPSLKARRPSKSKQAVELPSGLVRLKNSKPKYQITDISGQLSGTSNVTLQIGWNVQPWVGALTWTMAEESSWARWRGIKGGASEAFDMPSLKVKGVNQEVVKGSGKPEKAAEASPIVK